MSRNINKAEALKRIDSVTKYVNDILKEALEFRNKTQIYPLKIPAFDYLNKREIVQLGIRLKQTLIDMSPKGSEYWNYAASVGPIFTFESVANLFGALKSLREDYSNDFLKSFNEMVDADIFTDVLEQAEYLLSQGYLRASAVVAGVALESHLRKLAEKNSIPIAKDDGSYLNADFLNGELRKKDVVDKNLNQHITSWLGLRNDAAHPDPKEIDARLVEQMILGIRVFIEKCPA